MKITNEVENKTNTIAQENTELRLELSKAKDLIAFLLEQLYLLKHQKFGSSSEKMLNQPNLFNDAECIADNLEEQDKNNIITDDSENTENCEDCEDDSEPDLANPKMNKRKALPDYLPRTIVNHDLPESEKECQKCGSELKFMRTEDSEQFILIPAKIEVVVNKRNVYKCTCCEGVIKTAAKPPQAIEKSIASPSLLSFVIMSKHVDRLPLYHINSMFDRIGVQISRTTLSNWMIKCGILVQPLVNLMQERILEQECIHMDETRVQVLSVCSETLQAANNDTMHLKYSQSSISF
ncbi:hypothetical protein AwWohl_00260 [Gammaproteobacteria bacterium]|nr:hypothetical protein AwWohl_00260 [Gammaproteobacteria bacterium]